MTAPAPSAADQVDQEIQATLEVVDDLGHRSRRDELPGWLLLRAARASWLVGNTDWAKDFYRRAAVALTAYALDTGRRTATFEQYAGAASGAAWMSGERDVLAECGRDLDAACEQMLTSTDLPPEPLIRTGLLLTRLRLAWFREQTTLAREYEVELARRVASLEAWSKAAWQAERSSTSFATLVAFVTLRATPATTVRALPPGQPTPLELARRALQVYDRRLWDERARPPTVCDLVDEEEISFAAALTALNVSLPSLRLPVAPGKYTV